MRITIEDRTDKAVKTFDVQHYKGESVLDLLERLRETEDPSLAFYGSCGIGKCGACGIRVDGRECLACAEEVENKDYCLAPSVQGTFIRDLLCVGAPTGRTENMDDVR